MKWRRRQYRVGERPERSFEKRFGYEVVKEIGGTVFQYAGMGVGALTGLAGGALGLPGTASVVAGTVVGTSIGAIGKAYLTARTDLRRERKEREARTTAPTQATSRNQPTQSKQDALDHRSHPHRVDPTIRLRDRPRRRSGRSPTVRLVDRGTADTTAAGVSPMRQFIATLEKLIAQLDQASAQLNTLMTQMWESQHRITATLAGARPDVVRRTHDQTNSARLRVHDAATLTRQAADALRAYRAGL